MYNSTYYKELDCDIVDTLGWLHGKGYLEGSAIPQRFGSPDKWVWSAPVGVCNHSNE